MGFKIYGALCVRNLISKMPKPPESPKTPNGSKPLGPKAPNVNPKKLETGCQCWDSVYMALKVARIEAIGFTTFRLLQYVLQTGTPDSEFKGPQPKSSWKSFRHRRGY